MLDAIDNLNKQDQRSVEWQGQSMPYELAYSMWLTDWVKQLEPNPSEELQIVARGQHVERWKSPRSSYPEVGTVCTILNTGVTQQLPLSQWRALARLL